MKLSGINITNFRIFENQAIDFKPITFITGANSSGKSSIFKALMLLQDNIQKNQLSALDFSADNHSLGAYSLVKNKNAKSELIEFEVVLENKNKFFNAEQFIFKYQFIQDSRKLNNGLLVGLEISGKIKNISTLLLRTNIVIDEIKNQYNFNAFVSDILDCLGKENSFLKDLKILMYPIRNKITNRTIEKEQQERLLENEIDFEKKQNNYVDYFSESQKSTLKNIENDILERQNQLLKVENQEDRDELENEIKSLQDSLIESENEFKDSILSKYIDDYEEVKNLLDDVPKFRDKIYGDIYAEIQNKLMSYIAKKSFKTLEEYSYFSKSRNLIETIIEKNDWRIEVENIANEVGDISLSEFFEWEKLDFLRHEIQDIKISEIIGGVTVEGETTTTENYFEYLIINNIKSLIKLSVSELPFINLPAFRAYQTQAYNLNSKKGVIENIISDYLRLDYNEMMKKHECKKFVEVWLKAFKIGDSIHFEPVKDVGNSYYVKIKNEGKDFNLADMGFGISQLIPIILSCANPNNKDKLICIEEPETNLHPKFQSMLAEMFVDANKEFGVQFALETHSEYLIRKVQELVANKTIKNKNDALIYYFNKPQGKQPKKPEIIDFDENGKIDYWKFGNGFYDTDYFMDFGLLNMQAKTLFEKLKDDLTSLSEEEQQIKMEERIRHYASIQDLGKWEQDLKQILGNKFTRLNEDTRSYLTSAKFFLGIFDKSKETQSISKKIDFAPILVQYGRAIEIELQEVFTKFRKKYPYEFKRELPKITADWQVVSFEQMQQMIESDLINPELLDSFSEFLNNPQGFINILKRNIILNNNQKLGNNSSWLYVIRKYRNSSAHKNREGVWNYNTAIKYERYIIEFFKLWCSHLK